MASSWNKGTLVEQADSAVDVAIASASRAVQEGKSLFQSVVDEAADKLAQGAEAIQGIEIVSPELEEALQARPRPTGIAEVNVPDIPDPLGFMQEGVEDLGQLAMTLWNLGTSTPAKLLKEDLLLFDSVKEQSTITENAFKPEEIEYLREIVRRKGTGSLNKEDYGKIKVGSSVRGATEKGELSSGSLSLPEILYNSIGGAKITKDSTTGEYFVEDVYDWNLYVDYEDTSGGIDPKTGRNRGVVYTTEAFEEKFNPMEELFKTLSSDASKYEKAHNIAFLLGSRQYKDSSKNTGRKVKINLGVL
jgi:hypothetical protein